MEEELESCSRGWKVKLKKKKKKRASGLFRFYEGIREEEEEEEDRRKRGGAHPGIEGYGRPPIGARSMYSLSPYKGKRIAAKTGGIDHLSQRPEKTRLYVCKSLVVFFFFFSSFSFFPGRPF